MFKKNLFNSYGVSHVVGYIMMFAVVSLLTASTIFTAGVLIEQKTVRAAEMQAQAIANHVADAIIEAASIKMQLPYSNYTRYIDIPRDIAGKSYYIKLDEYNIYVKSYDGSVSINQTNYNLEELLIGTSGLASGSNGRIKVFFNKSDYMYKLDFGTKDSLGQIGYERVNFSKTNTPWWNNQWRCRIPFFLNNTADNLYEECQFKIDLNPTLLGYQRINENASDIRFIDQNEHQLDYWIQDWSTSGMTRIWVNVTSIPPEGTTIYMYYDNPSATPVTDGSKTFPFFDDFNIGVIAEDKWNIKGDDVEVDDGSLVIIDKGALISKEKVYNLIDSNSIVSLECKAKAQTYFSNNLEASMFLFSTSGTDVYSNSYLFSSGSINNNPSRNLSLVKNNKTILSNGIKNLALDKEWKNLKYMYFPDSQDHSLFRYNYNPYYLEDQCGETDSSYTNNYFGLCTCYDNVKAIYDWVFLRKVPSGIIIDIGLEECLDYHWDTSDLASLSDSSNNYPNNLLRKDSVYSSKEDISFNFDNLTSDTYSVSFIIGDNNTATKDLSIKVNNGNIQKTVFNDLNCEAGNYIERWFTVKTNKNITITFSGNHVKHICGLILERGIKGIKVRGV